MWTGEAAAAAERPDGAPRASAPSRREALADDALPPTAVKRHGVERVALGDWKPGAVAQERLHCNHGQVSSLAAVATAICSIKGLCSIGRLGGDQVRSLKKIVSALTMAMLPVLNVFLILFLLMSIGAPMRARRYATRFGTGTGQARDSLGAVTGQSRDRHGAVTGESRGSHGTVTGQSRGSHGTVTGQPRDSPGSLSLRRGKALILPCAKGGKADKR